MGSKDGDFPLNQMDSPAHGFKDKGEVQPAASTTTCKSEEPSAVLQTLISEFLDLQCGAAATDLVRKCLLEPTWFPDADASVAETTEAMPPTLPTLRSLSSFSDNNKFDLLEMGNEDLDDAFGDSPSTPEPARRVKVTSPSSRHETFKDVLAEHEALMLTGGSERGPAPPVTSSSASACGASAPVALTASSSAGACGASAPVADGRAEVSSTQSQLQKEFHALPGDQQELLNSFFPDIWPQTSVSRTTTTTAISTCENLPREQVFMDILWSTDALALGHQDGMPSPEVDRSLIEAFQTFDKDGDGLAHVADIRADLLEKMGYDTTMKITLEEILAAADSDGDGKLNYEEFLRMTRACV